MKLSGRPLALRLLATASLVLVALLGARDARAQNPPRKLAGGPYVIPGTPRDRIEAGRTIQWDVGPITNASPSAGVFRFVDDPGSTECEPPEPPAAEGWLQFPDEGDGTCDAFVTVDAPASGYTITCDVATGHLQVDNINLAAFATTHVHFQTIVDARAVPGNQICNQGHIQRANGTEISPTYPPSGNTAGCTCLDVSPPSGFDVQVTKSATIVPPATKLIPNQPDALIQYTITATNTGSQDITNAQFRDVVGGATVAAGKGLEWVRVDDCPAGLSCTINPTNTQLTVTGINLPSADPDTTVSIVATARVTCAAATNIDDGEVCNHADFSVPGQPGTFPTDDPSTLALGDATCLPVVWSNLTPTQKIVEGYDDTSPANGQLDPGERVHFLIRVRNDGTLTASGVTVSDDVGATGCLDPTTITALDSGVVAGNVVTWTVGDIAPLGGTRDVHFSAKLTSSTLCCNQGTVQSTERDGCGQSPIQTDDDNISEDPAVTPADPSCISPGPQPDLLINKTVGFAAGGDANGNGQFDVGDHVTWTVTVTNNGAGPATAAQFSDALPACMRNFTGAAGVTLTTSEPGGDAGDTSCSIAYAPPVNPGTACVNNFGGADGIIPGETLTVAFDSQIVGQVTNCCNQAQVTYAERATPKESDDPSTPGLVDDATCLQPPPCQPTGQLQKSINRQLDTDLDARLEVGERIEYLLTFTNVGCGDLTNIRIQDGSQACMNVDSTTVSINPPGSGINNSTPGQLDVLITGPLAPSASVTILFQAVGNAVEPNCCNQATWTATEVPAGGLSDRDPTDFTPNEPTCNGWLAQDSTTTGNPDLVVTKTALESACVDPGTTIHYQIAVDNVGDGSLNTFRLTDTLPPSLTNVQVTAPLTYDAGTNTVSVTGGPLAALGSVGYSFTAQVPCAGSGTITNTAHVTYTDNVPSDQQREDSVDVTYGLPDLVTSSKTFVANRGANGVLEPGETVDFTITVRNTGTCLARNVVVRDTVDAAFDAASATVQDGGSVLGTIVRWDSTGNPALTSIAPGGTVTLRFTVPVAAGVTTETHVVNTADIEAQGHDLSACGGTFPTANPLSGDICINCAGNQVDLLENQEVTALGAATAEFRTTVFNNRTPNACNAATFTSLDRTSDVLQPNVGASLPTGLTIPAATVNGHPLVFIEISDYCTVGEEGGADPPIFVCRDRATGDLTVKSSATPVICP